MFIKEWILNYINTPELQLTLADKALFYIALSIIIAVILLIIVVIGEIHTRLKLRHRNRKESLSSK